MPAQPQEHSFLLLSCGALSVPRKYFVLPLVTASTIARPFIFLFLFFEKKRRKKFVKVKIGKSKLKLLFQ